MVIEWIAIGVSIIAIGIAIGVWKNSKIGNQNKNDDSSMIVIMRLLSTNQTREHKKNVAFWYWNRIDRGKPINFEESRYEENASALKKIFEEACTIYEQNLVNKEAFREIYGGTVVRFWNILKTDILKEQEKNSNLYKNFQKVATELIEIFKISSVPYRTRP